MKIIYLNIYVKNQITRKYQLKSIEIIIISKNIKPIYLSISKSYYLR